MFCRSFFFFFWPLIYGFWILLFRPFGFLAPIDFEIIWLSILLTLCAYLMKVIPEIRHNIYVFISSPDPKGQVSYCHHLASVVRRKLFQKSSPLKVLDQWKPNLVWIVTRVSSFKIVSSDAMHQPTWPLLLKIEHW